MKILPIIFTLLTTQMAKAQTLNGMDLAQMPSVRYMEVVVTEKAPFTKKYFAKADFGQGMKSVDKGFQEDGEEKEFKSEIHVLNWLSGYEWRLIRDWNDGPGRHFLVERTPDDGK